MKIYSQITENSRAGKKSIAALIDPDKINSVQCGKLAEKAVESGIDYLFVGSSILTGKNFSECICILKETSIPVILFPGNLMQIDENADALLFLSLISGRNPEMLIGRHVIAAPQLKQSSLEIMSTGYMLIDSGSPTSVSYMSGTNPIPHAKEDIAVCTAIAGEMLGLKLIYMDAGSGARFPVSMKMTEAVKQNIQIPLIVGGGIRTAEKASEICQAGADIIVIGNAFEKEPEIISEMSAAVHAYQTI
jgi:putative glycerol-1-phosphate prenyltransferase